MDDTKLSASKIFPGCPELGHLTTHSGESWSEFRKTLKPKYAIVWRDILCCHLMILLSPVLIAVMHHTQGENMAWVLAPMAALWMGYWMQALLNFGHEALHHNIAPNKKMNDVLANLLIFSLIGLDVKWSRQYHWTHHLNLGNTQDSEVSYHNRLTPLFLLQTLTGIYFLKSIIPYIYDNKKEHSTKQVKQGESLRRYTALIRALVLHSSIITASLYFQCYALVATWLVGAFLFYPAFLALRQIVEHSSPDAKAGTNFKEEDYGIVNRLFHPGLLSLTFGTAGFDKHAIHHWDPSISYTRFSEMENFFMDSVLKEQLDNYRCSYMQTFFKLFKS